MSYQQALDFIKAAGFEQWSWVIAVLIGLVVFVKWLFGSRKSSTATALPATSNAAHHASAVGQQIGGTGNVVIQHNGDPAHAQITLQILKAIEQKDQQLAEKDARILELSISQKQDRQDAVATVVEESAKPHPTALAIQARQELLSGNIDAAIKLLFNLSDIARGGAKPFLHDAARYAREAGALLIGRDVTQAVAAYERVLLIEPDNLAVLDALIRLYSSAGDSSKARVMAVKLVELAQARSSSDPKNTGWQRDLSVSFNKVAGILEAQGERDKALLEYRKSLAIFEKLVASDPKNTEWQRDLSISYERVAGILEAQGERNKALLEYRKSLEIREKLAGSDPKNTDWQRNLSISYARVAGILDAQGERDKAMLEYRKSLAISEKLAASDPKNTDWQHDLSISYERVAGILEAQGERDKALLEYRKSLAIAEKLAASDTKNTNWQRDLSASFNKVAGILEPRGERENALLEYRKGLVIAEKLASSDPKNTDWQTDLVVSYWQISGLEASKEAIALLQQGVSILTRLTATGALRADQKGWQAMLQSRLDGWKP